MTSLTHVTMAPAPSFSTALNTPAIAEHLATFLSSAERADCLAVGHRTLTQSIRTVETRELPNRFPAEIAAIVGGSDALRRLPVRNIPRLPASVIRTFAPLGPEVDLSTTFLRHRTLDYLRIAHLPASVVIGRERGRPFIAYEVRFIKEPRSSCMSPLVVSRKVQTIAFDPLYQQWVIAGERGPIHSGALIMTGERAPLNRETAHTQQGRETLRQFLTEGRRFDTELQEPATDLCCSCCKCCTCICSLFNACVYQPNQKMIRG